MRLYDYIMDKVSRCIALAPFMCIIVLVLAICSCRSVKYVPVETVKHDSIYINKVQVDSVYHRDSIYVVDKGDTVFLYKDRYIYKYKDRTDTLYVTNTYSIQVPYPVEKELTKWQQFRMDFGGWAIAAVIIIVLIFFGRLVYKLKK
jgi:hypothetical protein|nr:MAG TPA_asm: Ribosome biogenesis protein RPF2, Regulator complex, components of 90S.9A [Caudoviricetes sp.]